MSSEAAFAGRGGGATRVAPERRTDLRLTRRGRLVLLAIVATALVALLGVTRTAVAWAEPTGPTTQTVVVQAGDSLWSIAKDVDPKRDPRAVIADIEELNALSGGGLIAGQALTVPA